MSENLESSKKSASKKNLVAIIKQFITRDIWSVSMSDLKGWRSFIISILRVIITTVNGIVSKRIFVQASSLSYATLLAIGPILAITIMFSGIFFRDKGEDFIYEKIMSAATFVMPAFNEMLPNGASADTATTAAATTKVTINPQIFEFINNISKGSSQAGAIGIITMLVTCLLLCINMESAFNYIWGVRKGRNWIDRIVFYFAMIFFGSVGTVFGMTFLATSEFASLLQNVPLMSSSMVSVITYWLGMGLLAFVLASFYKFIPCVKVRWIPACVGALVIIFLLVLNNNMSFIYISYIAKQQSFYGYLAIVAVAMFSLYIFWVMILAGGQITYAVQYINFLSDDDSWKKLGARGREFCALAVFGQISQDFYNGGKPTTIESLSTDLRLPKVVIAASTDCLLHHGLICTTDSVKNNEDNDCLKPAISPDSITASMFFDEISEGKVDKETISALAAKQPLIAAAMKSLEEFNALPNSSKSIKELL